MSGNHKDMLPGLRDDYLAWREKKDEPSGRDWRQAALTGMWAVLFAVIGWVATDASSKRDKMADEVASHAQRIAILEEQLRNVRETNRNTTESLIRIESGISQLRQQDRGRR